MIHSCIRTLLVGCTLVVAANASAAEEEPAHMKLAEKLCEGSYPSKPNLREQTAIPAAGLAANLSTAGVLSALLSVSGDDTSAVLNIAPLRPTNWNGLWGLQATIGYDSDNKQVLLGAGYRIDGYWLFPDESVDSIKRSCVRRLSGTPPLIYWVELDRIANKLKSEKKPDEIQLYVQESNWAAEEVGALPVADEKKVKSALEKFPIAGVFDTSAGVRKAKDSTLEALKALKSSLEPFATAAKESALKPPAERILRDARKSAYLSLPALLPTLTLGWNVNAFPFQPTEDKPKAIAKQGPKISLEWRVTPRFEATGSASFSWDRQSPVNDPDTAGNERYRREIWETGATAMIIFPEVFGLTLYNDKFFEDGVVRGLGFGPTMEFKTCKPSEGGADCKDNVRESLFLGGALDLLVSKDLRPRIRAGYRTAKVADEDVQDGFDLMGTVVFTVDKNLKK